MNNEAERGVRKGVLWRHKSQGSRSEAGSRFVERILAVAATCRQNDRPVLAYLTEVREATLHGQPPPSFVPQLPDKPPGFSDEATPGSVGRERLQFR